MPRSRWGAYSDLSPEQKRLVDENMGLVHAVVTRRFYKYVSFEHDELANEGFLGLVRAAQFFDPERGFKFSTYASHCIWGACSHYVRDVMQTRKGGLPDPTPRVEDKPVEDNLDAVLASVLAERAIAALPEKLHHVLPAMMGFSTIAAVAKSQGVYEPTIHRRIKKAKAIMRRAVEPPEKLVQRPVAPEPAPVVPKRRTQPPRQRKTAPRLTEMEKISLSYQKALTRRLAAR